MAPVPKPLLYLLVIESKLLREQRLVMLGRIRIIGKSLRQDALLIFIQVLRRSYTKQGKNGILIFE